MKKAHQSTQGLQRGKPLTLAVWLVAALTAGAAWAQTKDHIVVLSEPKLSPVLAKETVLDDRYALQAEAWGYLPPKLVKEVQRLEKRHTVVAKQTFGRVMTGFSAPLTPAQVAALRNEPSVAWVEEDQVVSAQLLDLGVLNTLLGLKRPTGATRAPSATDTSNPASLALPPNTPSGAINSTPTGTASGQTVSYGIASTAADKSWAVPGDGEGTVDGPTVYVIDTGIAENRDLNLVKSINFAGGPVADCSGHGTHVAGIVGARDNALDTVGVAPGVRLVSVKALGCNNLGSVSNVIKAIDWVAQDAGPRSIANLSFSLPGTSLALERAVLAAADKGLLFNIAAGNYAANACRSSPASQGGGANPTVLTIAAVDRKNEEARFSNFGNCVDVWAPGVDVPSTRYTGGVSLMSGTSMAVPHVSGAAALYWAVNPSASAAQVATYVRQNRAVGSNNAKDGQPLRLLRADVRDNRASTPTATPTTAQRP